MIQVMCDVSGIFYPSFHRVGEESSKTQYVGAGGWRGEGLSTVVALTSTLLLSQSKVIPFNYCRLNSYSFDALIFAVLVLIRCSERVCFQLNNGFPREKSGNYYSHLKTLSLSK